MTSASDSGAAWADAMTAAALLAVDPGGCGGIVVRANAGPVLTEFLRRLGALLSPARPMVKVPASVTDDRLIGGLDLQATLRLGRPVLEAGLLAWANDGVLLIPNAERLPAATAARIAAAHGDGSVAVEREGVGGRFPARFCLVLVDESSNADEALPASLADRAAFRVDLTGVSCREIDEQAADAPPPECRHSLRSVPLEATAIELMVEACDALGIALPAAPYLALMAARASAALEQRSSLDQHDLELATRLVLAPRATRMPAPEQQSASEDDEQSADPQQQEQQQEQEPGDQDDAASVDLPSLDMLLAAVAAVLPPDLLSSARRRERSGSGTAGHVGRFVTSKSRGARLASRSGTPASGERLDVIATLRAAAPFQALRRAEAVRHGSAGAISVRARDLRVARFKQQSETLTVFVVDASGSSALHRLAEAKGAVELLLADCYVRRDWVSVVAFRGTGSSILLPPTRSLTRAKRCLSELAGGGGTPLASAMKTAFDLVRAAGRQGRTATTVFLTDGRANIALDGKPGRGPAEADAMAVARSFSRHAERTVVIDTGQRPHPFTKLLAANLDGRYLALPYADAASVNSAVRSLRA